MPQKSNIVGDLGTTKLASDSYDIDNIYLTEEGWVYRHFKSTDNSRWWDVIIVAGEVPAGDSPQATNPPKLGTVAAPAYETGDGAKDWEYSSHQRTGIPGDYTDKIVPAEGGGGLGVGDGQAPEAGDIGEIGGTAPSGTITPGVAYTYTATAEGAGTAFAWATSDASATLSATTGASITITWATSGPQTVTVTATLAGAGDTGKTKTYNESVTAFTIGNVNKSAPASVIVNDSAAVGVGIDGNVTDETYAWSIVSANSGNGSFTAPTEAATFFSATQPGTYSLRCAVTSTLAGGAGGDGQGTINSNFNIEVVAA